MYQGTPNNLFRRDGSDSIGGELNLSNNKIVNVANPTSAQDVATKHYADSRKPVITIWAQEAGPLNRGEYEWSFGSGDCPRTVWILYACFRLDNSRKHFLGP